MARRGAWCIGGIFLPAACLLAASGTQVVFRYSIQDLGTLGGLTSIALDINEAGHIVGSADASSGYRHAYLWEDGLMTDLGTYGAGVVSEAWAVNEAAVAVGGSLRFENGTVTVIHNNVQSAFGIDNSGRIVGQAGFVGPGGGDHAFLYENGVLTDLGTLGGMLSLAWDINEVGQIAGAAATTGGSPHAFLWENGVMFDLGTLGGTTSVGLGINDLGHIVGTSRWTTSNSIPRAFLWNGQQMIDLDGGRWTYSEAWGINNHGQVVGSGETAPEYRGFLYDPMHGVIDLQNSIVNNPGWTEINPRDINDAGQIVGAGTNPQGFRRAFLMNPLPPIPATSGWTLAAAALGLVLLGTVLLRRRSKTSP